MVELGFYVKRIVIFSLGSVEEGFLLGEVSEGFLEEGGIWVKFSGYFLGREGVKVG